MGCCYRTWNWDWKPATVWSLLLGCQVGTGVCGGTAWGEESMCELWNGDLFRLGQRASKVGEMEGCGGCMWFLKANLEI